MIASITTRGSSAGTQRGHVTACSVYGKYTELMHVGVGPQDATHVVQSAGQRPSCNTTLRACFAVLARRSSCRGCPGAPAHNPRLLAILCHSYVCTGAACAVSQPGARSRAGRARPAEAGKPSSRSRCRHDRGASGGGAVGLRRMARRVLVYTCSHIPAAHSKPIFDNNPSSRCLRVRSGDVWSCASACHCVFTSTPGR
jgi:hypothetical protein